MPFVVLDDSKDAKERLADYIDRQLASASTPRAVCFGFESDRVTQLGFQHRLSVECRASPGLSLPTHPLTPVMSVSVSRLAWLLVC